MPQKSGRDSVFVIPSLDEAYACLSGRDLDDLLEDVREIGVGPEIPYDVFIKNFDSLLVMHEQLQARLTALRERVIELRGMSVNGVGKKLHRYEDETRRRKLQLSSLLRLIADVRNELETRQAFIREHAFMAAAHAILPPTLYEQILDTAREAQPEAHVPLRSVPQSVLAALEQEKTGLSQAAE